MECRHKFTLCRLCLCESECFNDIFELNDWYGYVAAEAIRDLLQFQVSKTDGFPHVVCSVCLAKLSDFKHFKEQCQNSKDTYNNVYGSDKYSEEDEPEGTNGADINVCEADPLGEDTPEANGADANVCEEDPIGGDPSEDPLTVVKEELEDAIDEGESNEDELTVVKEELEYATNECESIEVDPLHSSRVREEIIANDVPSQEQLHPVPVKLVHVSIGNEGHYNVSNCPDNSDQANAEVEIHPEVPIANAMVGLEECTTGSDYSREVDISLEMWKWKMKSIMRGPSEGITNDQETSQERRRRLARERLKRWRARQNQETLNRIRQKNTDRMSQQREQESREQTQARREADARAHREARQQESPEQAQARRLKNLQSQQQRREQESPEQTQARHDADARAHREARQQESPEQAQERRLKNLQSQQQRREQESPEQAQARREADARAHREARQQESPEQAQARRLANLQCQQRRREQQVQAIRDLHQKFFTNTFSNE